MMTASHQPLTSACNSGDRMTSTTITAAEASLKANGRTFHWARRSGRYDGAKRGAIVTILPLA